MSHEEQVKEILSLLCGMDKEKQIIGLWLEVIYHRELIQSIFDAIPWIFDTNGMSGIERNLEKQHEEGIKKCLGKAKEELLKKFPNLGITFPANENKKAPEEN